MRASESRDQAEDESGEYISECAITRAVGDSSIDGDERRLAKQCSLFNFSLKAVRVRREFTERMLHNPLKILELIGTRLAEIEVEHYRAAFQLADSRVSALLLELANEDLIIEGLSHKDLALRIGLYRETITNVLSVMKQDKLIKVGRERITILDKRALQELSEF